MVSTACWPITPNLTIHTFEFAFVLAHVSSFHNIMIALCETFVTFRPTFAPITTLEKVVSGSSFVKEGNSTAFAIFVGIPFPVVAIKAIVGAITRPD